MTASKLGGSEGSSAARGSEPCWAAFKELEISYHSMVGIKGIGFRV